MSSSLVKGCNLGSILPADVPSPIGTGLTVGEIVWLPRRSPPAWISKTWCWICWNWCCIFRQRWPCFTIPCSIRSSRAACDCRRTLTRPASSDTIPSVEPTAGDDVIASLTPSATVSAPSVELGASWLKPGCSCGTTPRSCLVMGGIMIPLLTPLVNVQLGAPSKVLQTMNGGCWMPAFSFYFVFPKPIKCRVLTGAKTWKKSSIGENPLKKRTTKKINFKVQNQTNQQKITLVQVLQLFNKSTPQ